MYGDWPHYGKHVKNCTRSLDKGTQLSQHKALPLKMIFAGGAVERLMTAPNSRHAHGYLCVDMDMDMDSYDGSVCIYAGPWHRLKLMIHLQFCFLVFPLIELQTSG